MHRIDGAGATIDNLFTEGDPTQGVPATTVTGAWLNAVQEEIANVVEGAGLALDKLSNTQLYEAIVALVLANQQIGFDTGDVKLTLVTTAPTGWLMCDDGTIGKSGSAATSRANDDCEALFTLLWSNVADGFAPVSGGRGGSAALDWAAGKTIGLTRMLGRAIGIAGAGASLTSRQLGQYMGAETHVLTAAEIPAHSHPNTLTDPGHSHAASFRLGVSAGGLTYAYGGTTDNANQAVSVSANATGITINNANNTGGGGAHNNMQPTTFLNAMVKL